jgi:glycosyltransferase involved in cell wall biosynthesis
MCLIRHAARAPLGALLLVIAVLWLGAAIHGLLAGDPAIVPGLGAGGAYLVGALGVALALLALDWMVRGRTVVISQGAVAVTDCSLRGGRAWREPLANYREIRAYRELRTHRAGVRSWYMVRLWHPEPTKAIELACDKDPALIERHALDWARRLGLPLSWQQDEPTAAATRGASGTGAIVPGSDIRPGALWEGLPAGLTPAGSRELSGLPHGGTVRDAPARVSGHSGTMRGPPGRAWSARQHDEAVVAAPEQVSTGTASTMDSRSKLVTVEVPSGSTAKRKAVLSAPASRRKRLVYFLNAFDRGGAELGLVFLARSGFFDPFDSEIVAVCRGSGHSVDELTRLGFAPTALFPDQHMTIRHMAGALPRLLALLRHTRPDLVILSLPQANIVGRIAARLAGVPTVATFEHNTHLARRIYESLYLVTSPAVDILLADCNQTAKVALRRRYLARNLPRFVLPLCAFSSACPKRPASGTRIGPGPRIVSVGRLTRVKNHRCLIEAIALLSRQGLNLELEIFGVGPLRQELEGRATTLGIAHLVVFRGFISRWWEQTDANLFVLTSLCMAVLEAMWAGIPVVAPRIGGLADHGGEETMAVLTDLRPETVARAVSAAIERPGLAAERADRARLLIREGWSLEAVKERIGTISAALAAVS